MCRFALITSKKSIQPKIILEEFAEMAKNSHALDGDWQGDGWGIAWLEDNQWYGYTSLLPVWKDKEKFKTFNKTKKFLIHARSASFLQQKGILAYNQPYISDNYAFVFNGFLKGVSLSQPIPGKIGAEKIWFLLQEYLKKNTPEEALKKVRDVLLKHSREIVALNIGLVSNENMSALCYFSRDPEYYQLQYRFDDGIGIICSEKLDDFVWQRIMPREVIGL